MNVEYTKAPFPFGSRVWRPGDHVRVIEAVDPNVAPDYEPATGYVQGRTFAGGEMLLCAHLNGEDVVLAPEDIVDIEAL